MSDRVMVMCEGRVAGVLSREEASDEAVMKLAVGVRIRMNRTSMERISQQDSKIGVAVAGHRIYEVWSKYGVLFLLFLWAHS